MRSITVDPVQLEVCATQVEQLKSNVEHNIAVLYQRVETMSVTGWIGSDNLAFTRQIEGYHDDFYRVLTLMQQYVEFLRMSARSYRQMQQELAAQAGRLNS